MHSSRNPAATTKPCTTMRLLRLNLILVPSLLTVAMPAWAEARLAAHKPAPPRPLNLSLPRDLLHAPGTAQADDTVQRNLRAPQPVEADTVPPARLRYGAGYEQRLREMGGAAGPGPAGGAGVGGAPGAGGAGAGRRGR